ncbi:MAG TPA: VOC family protein [Kribbella sp.]|nr:VOC family protein [Kribbella sp.]
MGIGLAKIRQVKIPVTDLAGSVAWYRHALDLELAAEFVEQGELRGAVLADRASGFLIALRDRELCAGRPALAGFDVVGFEITDRETFHRIVARWDELGIEHTAVWDGGSFGLGVDVQDPDGTVLRFLCGNPIGRTEFHGVEYDENGQVTFYDEPKLAET